MCDLARLHWEALSSLSVPACRIRTSGCYCTASRKVGKNQAIGMIVPSPLCFWRRPVQEAVLASWGITSISPRDGAAVDKDLIQFLLGLREHLAWSSRAARAYSCWPGSRAAKASADGGWAANACWRQLDQEWRIECARSGEDVDIGLKPVGYIDDLVRQHRASAQATGSRNFVLRCRSCPARRERTRA